MSSWGKPGKTLIWKVWRAVISCNSRNIKLKRGEKLRQTIYLFCFALNILYLLLPATSKQILAHIYYLGLLFDIPLFLWALGMSSKIRWKQRKNPPYNLVHIITELKPCFLKKSNEKQQNVVLFDNKSCTWHQSLQCDKSEWMLLEQ